MNSQKLASCICYITELSHATNIWYPKIIFNSLILRYVSSLVYFVSLDFSCLKVVFKSQELSVTKGFNGDADLCEFSYKLHSPYSAFFKHSNL